MGYLKNGWMHFKTITHHRHLVMKSCFQVGLYKQGLLHDLSKYNPVEFKTGVMYYQGDRSPNNAEREDKGLSEAWLHHKGRNKHHLEYWIDYNVGGEGSPMCGMKMPVKYVVEMFLDRIAACKNYQKEAYTDKSPLEYYERGKNHYLLHDESRALLEEMLNVLAERGEKEAFLYVRKNILHNA